MIIKVKNPFFWLKDRILICLQMILFSSSLNYCMKVWQVKLFHNSDSSNSIYIYAVIFVFFILGVVPLILKRMKPDIVILGCLLVVFYLISYALNGREAIFFDNTIIWTFGNGFVSYIIIRYIDNWEYAMDRYAFLSKIMLCVIIVCWLVTKSEINYRFTSSWYMFFSSALFFPVIGTFLQYEKNKKLFDLALVIAGIFLIFMYGARGTLVQIIVFFIGYYILNGKYLEGIEKCILAITALMLGFKYVLMHVDISTSRTLSLLFSNAIGDTDRTEAWKRMLEYFSEQTFTKQLFGLGLTGERLYIRNNIYEAGYPHNILIEQLLQLGIIGFIILALISVWLSVRTFVYGYKTEFASAIALFGAYAILLLLSGSYLSSNQFFAWIALCLNVLETKQSKRLLKLSKQT